MLRKISSSVALALACIALAGAASAHAADRVLFAAGDIACDPLDPNFNAGGGTATACRQQATADLINGSFDAVLALGDLQYNEGALIKFQQSYDLSWGRVKAKTRPVIGNHEGITADSGAGYCTYFGAAAHCNASGRQGAAAFYSFNLGDWHVVVLNSNCDAAGGCDVGSPQYQWLQNDLVANQRACTLAAWHHPRWSSGHDGSNAFMQPIWQLLWTNGADLVLSGHSHDYERFAPTDAAGAVNASDGMRSFVVGTGGAYFTGLSGIPAPGSEVRENTSFGVLRLGLHPTSYDWSFVPASGSTFTDSGDQFCRGFGSGGDLQPPSAPTGVTATQTSPTRVDVSWAPSTDNVGVTGYEVWRGTETGALARVATTSASATTYADTTVARGQSYRYQLLARDAAGNVSAPSETVSATPPGTPPPVTTPPATTPPVTTTVTTPPVVPPPGDVGAPHATGTSELLARWHLKPRIARRALARGWIRIPPRRWAPTIIRVRVDGRLAAAAASPPSAR
jgi:acid phosphatase type 7